MRNPDQLLGDSIYLRKIKIYDSNRSTKEHQKVLNSFLLKNSTSPFKLSKKTYLIKITKNN